MHYLADAAVFALLVLSLVVLGWWSAQAQRTKLENTLIGGTAFLGGYALVAWIVGLLTNTRLTLWLLLLGLALAFTIYFRDGWQKFRFNSIGILRPLRDLNRLEKLLCLYLLFIFALTFALTLAPPNGNDYDSLVYHLAAPQQYLRSGQIVELPYDHHSYFPFTMEMLYMVGLWLKGPVVAKLFHWLMLPVSCLALVAIGHRHLTLRAGLFAAALFTSIPVVQFEASTAYIDLGLTALSLLAFLCFANWLTSRDGWWLAWCGVFCGFCLGTKYLGVLTLGWLGLWALGSMAKRRDWNVPALAMFGGLAILLGSGWYLRNWIWTGNPVFPFAYEIFGGRGWTAEMAKAYSADQAVYGFGHSLSDWLWLPWRVAMAPLNTGQPFWPISGVAVAAPMLGRFEVAGHLLQTIIGPALLAFGAPLVALRRKPQIVGFALWSFLFFWVFWAASSQQLRYLIPAFGVLCLACGWGVQQYLTRSAILKWTTLISLCLWLLFGLAYSGWSARRTWPVISGKETPDAFLARTFSGYTAMSWASAQTPENARFAVYGEPRCFYLKRDYFWADDPHNNLIDYSRVSSGADLVRELQRLGATHLLANTVPERNGGVFAPPPQLQQAADSGLVRLLFEANGYRVYEIVAQSGGAH